MMMDNDVEARSPVTVYWVFKKADRLDYRPPGGTTKGTGFHQSPKPHEQQYINTMYMNPCGRFHYICGELDGCSRYLIQ